MVDTTPGLEDTDKSQSNDTGPKRITDDDLYRNSSQFKLWSFTKEQLEIKRQDLNASATAAVTENIRQFIENNKDLSHADIEAIGERAVPVTMEEELKFINFYAKKVQSFCQSLNLPTEVCATAISFFRRFFLTHSAMEIHPKHILLTSIFLASKSENYFIGIEAFAKKTKSKPEIILKYEFFLLESLQFTLLNHHPYKALHGFFLDIQFVLHGKVDLNYMSHVYTNCKKRVTEALLTDAVYFFTPPQIALACLLVEDEALTSKYFELKFGTLNEQQGTTNATHANKNNTVPLKDLNLGFNFDVILNLVRECQDIILVTTSFNKEEATRTDAKIHYCQNPKMLVERLKKQRDQNGTTAESSEPEQKKQKV